MSEKSSKWQNQTINRRSMSEKSSKWQEFSKIVENSFTTQNMR